MSQLLGQLIHTSFTTIGFTTLASKEIPPEIQQAFLQQIVYQYWDAYNPPSSTYHAAYLYQITPEHNLFGWLYNDGLDDFGRSDVPYFISYYLAGSLQSTQLENIWIWLHKGPIALIDRQNLPTSLESLATSQLWNYQPTRTGVEIPIDVREQSQITLQQGKLLDLFVAADEEIIPNYTFDHKQKLRSPTQTLPLTQMLLDHVEGRGSQEAVLTVSGRLTWMVGIVASGILLLCLIFSGYYFLRVTPFSGIVQPAPDSISTKNPTLALQKTLVGHADAVWSVVPANDGKILVSGSADQTIKVWNTDTGKIISTLAGHTDTVRAIALSSDGQTLVSGGGDRTIKIWNFQTFELIRTLTDASSSVWSVAISPDGQMLITGGEDGSIKMWNLPTGELLHTIAGHKRRVFSVAINPNGETFATGGIDKTIKIWSLQTGKLLRTITQHDDAVRTVVFSHDGKTLASGSWDQTIKIWDLSTGELLHTLIGHTSRVIAVTFSSDDQTIASGSTDNSIKIWSLQTGKLLRTLTNHSDWVLAIATSSGKQILASGSKDKTIRIWSY